MTEKKRKKRKHKKTLRRLERELGMLELIGVRASIKMFKVAMRLEARREPSSYVR